MISRDVIHNRLLTRDGDILRVDPNVEPLVQPMLSGMLQVWTLEAYGTMLANGKADDTRYHVVREFARKEDAVMLHDLLMQGKISWRQALRTIIERD